MNRRFHCRIIRPVLIVIAFAATPAVFACSCPPFQSNTFQQFVERADVVFLGRIVESKSTPTFVEIDGNRLGTLGTIDATFTVEKVYKWQKANHTQREVWTVDQGGACGFQEWAKPDFAELWLVFATYAGNDLPQPPMMPGNLPEGTLTALMCSGTGLLERSRTIFDYLESLMVR